MERLQKQCAQSTDEHRCVAMHKPYWSIFGEPSIARRVHYFVLTLIGIWSNYARA
jgi:hypothetical protein